MIRFFRNASSGAQPWRHSHGWIGDLRHDAVRPTGDLHDLYGAGRVDGVAAAGCRLAGHASHTPEREGKDNIYAQGVGETGGARAQPERSCTYMLALVEETHLLIGLHGTRRSLQRRACQYDQERKSTRHLVRATR